MAQLQVSFAMHTPWIQTGSQNTAQLNHVVANGGNFILKITSKPGVDNCIILSISFLVLRVDKPMSKLPVAATSNKQNWSSPQRCLAWASSVGSLNTGSYVGT